MAQQIGFDPVPETHQAKLWQFIFLAWKDAVWRIFDFKGRTSRAAFIAAAAPIVLIWFSLTFIASYRLFYNEVAFEAFGVGFAIVFGLIFFSLVIRRRHDSGTKASSMLNPLHLLNPFSSILSAMKLLAQGDAGDNQFGPPHVLGYMDQNDEPKPNPKNIG